MKHGESDFFRYLPLNRSFFRVKQRKLLELQARREYEGAGEYPSFIGWDCERFAEELSGCGKRRGHFGVVPDRRLASLPPARLSGKRRPRHLDPAQHRGRHHGLQTRQTGGLRRGEPAGTGACARRAGTAAIMRTR